MKSAFSKTIVSLFSMTVFSFVTLSILNCAPPIKFSEEILSTKAESGIPLTCPEKELTCETIGGFGTKTCEVTENGLVFSPCIENKCKSGFHFLVSAPGSDEPKICSPGDCTPGEEKVCENINNGSGIRKCGMSKKWSECDLNCDEGYFADATTNNCRAHFIDISMNGVKTFDAVLPAPTTALPEPVAVYPLKVTASPNVEFTEPRSELIYVSGSCLALEGKAGLIESPWYYAKEKEFSFDINEFQYNREMAQKYGGCTFHGKVYGQVSNSGFEVSDTIIIRMKASLEVCDKSQYYANNRCNTCMNEIPENSSYNNMGGTLAMCPYSCNAGFALVGNQCLPKICTPGESRACSVDNGVGTQACNTTGTAYESCSVASCNNGYVKDGNSCVLASCTGSTPMNAMLCAGDNTGLIANTPISLVGSCTDSKKCEYTCSADYYFNGTTCVAKACTPGSTRSCTIANGTGTQSCEATGAGYGSCSVASCNSGYVQSGNSCVLASCTGSVPTNSMVCSGDSTGLNTNTVISLVGSCTDAKKCEYICKTGYYFNGTSCVAQVCAPGSTRSCTITNGTGTQSCDTNGAGYGSCSVDSCNNGYVKNGNSCVLASCTGSAPTNAMLCTGDNTGLSTDTAISLVGSCTDSKKCEYTCNNGYYFNGTSCAAQVCAPGSTRSCTVDNGTGKQSCDSTGAGYGSCSVDSCNSGYVKNGNSCVLASCTGSTPMNAMLCAGDNTGLSTDTAISLVGSCTDSKKCEYTCSADYYFNGTSCVAKACTPGSTRSCTISNGTGTQSCDSSGAGYGSCSIASCNSGYVQSGNSCVLAVCTGSTPTNAMLCAGDNTGLNANTAISLVGSCTDAKKCEYACNSGYYFNGSSCVAQACSPGSSRSCTVANGTGTQSCDASGSGYGSCSVSSCNSGYYLSGGSCVAQVCAPGSSRTCAVSNGTGTQSCNTLGTGYGSCSVSSCNSGYILSGGSCIAQVCSPFSTRSCSVTNGTGSQSCNSIGSGYGSCSVTSCNSGYTLSGGSCVALPPRTIITGVAYCVEYQSGENNTWGWGCGGNAKSPSTWMKWGTASAIGCSSGTQSNQIYSVDGKILGYTCTSTTTNPDNSNEIVGAAYCNPGRNNGQGCGSGSSSTWKFVGASVSGGGCTQGTQSRPIYSPGGIVGYACIKGYVPMTNIGAQPSNQQMITGAAYCAETAGTAPNYYCPSWTTVGTAIASGSGACSDGGQVTNQRMSKSSGGLIGFTCKKTMWTLSGTDYYTGSAYCAENPTGTGGCGSGSTSTWIFNGTSSTGGCVSGHTAVSSIYGKGGIVGYTCRRN